MLIETTHIPHGAHSPVKITFDMLHVARIQEVDNDRTAVFLFGNESYFVVENPYLTMLADLKDAKLENKFSDSFTKSTSKNEKRETISIGEHSFMLNERTTDFDDGASKSIYIDATFPVKNDALKAIIEEVEGVEKYNEWSLLKYNGCISIGKLFDLKRVTDEVEQKIIDFLNTKKPFHDKAL